MKFKGTPGPWRIAPMGPNGCPVIGNNEVMVSMLAHSVNEEWQETEAIANAWLISAAPDLLEALLEMQRNGRKQGWSDNYESSMEKTSKAISKALGGEQ